MSVPDITNLFPGVLGVIAIAPVLAQAFAVNLGVNGVVLLSRWQRVVHITIPNYRLNVGNAVKDRSEGTVDNQFH